MIGPRTFVETYPSLRRTDVVEIDPAVVRVAKEHFYFKPGPETRVSVGDGRVFLAQSRETWDVVVLDAFSGGGRIPFHLLTREFFETMRDRISPDGLCVINLIGAVVGPKSKVFRGAFRTLSEVFSQTYAFPRTGHYVKTEKEGEELVRLLGNYANDPSSLTKEQLEKVEKVRNIMLVGTRGEERLSHEELRRRAAQMTGSGAVPARFELQIHAAALAPVVRTSDVPVLTDDFCPVEQWKTW